MEHLGTIDALFRYPVKSMLGEELTHCEVTSRGVVGDRALAVLDVATGKIVSAKNPRLWAAMLTLSGVNPPLDSELSALLGRPVRVISAPPSDAELERAVPEEVLDRGIAAEVAVTIGRIGGAAPGTFFDYAPLHLITTSTIKRIGELSPRGVVETVRYRPNLVINTPASGFVENDWVGRRLHVGDSVVLEVIVASPRCSIPTLAHGDLPRDTEALRTVARHNLVDVLDTGRRACAGVYARVLHPGKLTPGDPVRLAP